MKYFEMTVQHCHKTMLYKMLMIMKFSFILLFITGIQIHASVYPQTKINMAIESTTIREALKQIEKQTDYRFFYSDDLVFLDQQINLSVSDLSVEETLGRLFQKSDLGYKVYENNTVIVSVKERLQGIVITGVITDENGISMPGVNIRVGGTTTGVISDVNGKYTVTVPGKDAVLVYSFVGYVTREARVGDQTVINIELNEDMQEIEEVVVVGYGVRRKRDVTGAMVSVNNEELTSRPVNNALEAMQGKAAGVDITTSERPGELGTITIRGSRSLSASNRPLYVVDGIPLMDEYSSRTRNAFQSAGGIESINPQDIESIDILKDASATAIYGARGANGVVLVTTKRGTEGQLTLNYAGSFTFQQMAWREKYLNASELIDFDRWAYYNKGTTTTPGDQPNRASDEEIFGRDVTALANVMNGWESGTWDASKVTNTDWIDMVTQPNLTQEHTLSASGGTKNMKAYGSVGYLSNQGTTRGQHYKRYTAKASVDLTPKNWFEMGLSVNATLSKQDYGQSTEGAGISGQSANLVDQASRIYAYALPYDASGNVVRFPGGENRVPTVVDEWKYSNNSREITRVMASGFAQINIIDGLRYRVVFGPDFRYFHNGLYNDALSTVRGGSAYASLRQRRDFSWTVDNLLYYDKTFGQHAVGATLLQTASAWNTESSTIAGEGIAMPNMRWHALTKKDIPALDDWATSLNERQLMSYMARINYTFADKYLLTASGRWDGASQLAEGHKWSFFPSVALAWRMEQESFLKGITWIDQLKLRLGYGVTGNAAIDPYSTKGRLTASVYPYGTSLESGYATYDPSIAANNQLANNLLGWEKTAQFNVGIDFSIYRGRLAGGIDVYTSSTTDLLLTMPLPPTMGYAQTLANIGKTKNRGIDLTLNSVNIRTSDFRWTTNLTFTWQKDEIVSLVNDVDDIFGSNINNDSWFIGESISTYYNYENLGIWQDTPEDLAEMAKFNANGRNFKPGMSRPKDQNDDYEINPNDDQVIIGNRNPQMVMGMTNQFTYKNWDLSIFMTGRMKYHAQTGQALTAMYGNEWVRDYWTPYNMGARFQMPIFDQAGGDAFFHRYEDNSYIKVRNISLGYRLPQKVVDAMKISNVRVYAQVINPGMLWSNVKFWDADNGNSLHFNRSFVIGLNVGL
jgi:TonB-linked SusC/RagA family outer membrane protein